VSKDYIALNKGGGRCFRAEPQPAYLESVSVLSDNTTTVKSF
jgi:hypothetical protein